MIVLRNGQLNACVGRQPILKGGGNFQSLLEWSGFESVATSCRLADLVGMQVAYLTGKQYLAEWPDRTYGSKMIQSMFEDKRLGKLTEHS